MCADLNMPNPMAQHTFQEHLASIKSAAEVAAKQSMDTAAMELRNAMDVHGDELTDCRAMFDGTWRKRGHSSLQGAVTCISALTGKLLDYESLNKVCHKCARYANRDSDDYQNFMANHQCKANYDGSAASMEPTGIKRMYQRSISSKKLRYTEYVGDGDTSSFNSVIKDHPYGPQVTITKLECVGHVQKRLGSALRKLKQSKGNSKLSDGKTIGGKGK